MPLKGTFEIDDGQLLVNTKFSGENILLSFCHFLNTPTENFILKRMEYLQLVLPLVVVILILTVLCAALSCYIIRSRKNRQQMLDYSDAFNTRRISWSAPKRFENIIPESGIETYEVRIYRY